MITVAQLKQICEELRDTMSDERRGPLIDPFALDILANRPVMLQRLADKINQLEKQS